MSNGSKQPCCVYCAFASEGSRGAVACHMDIRETVYYCKKDPTRKAFPPSKAFALDSVCDLFAWRKKKEKTMPQRDKLRRMTQSLRLSDLAHAAHAIAGDGGFHSEPYSTTGMSFNYVAWVNQQLAHLFIEVGELADAFRKEQRLDMEEAADVFITLGDLICHTPELGVMLEEAIQEKLRKNLERGRLYGRHE